MCLTPEDPPMNRREFVALTLGAGAAGTGALSLIGSTNAAERANGDDLWELAQDNRGVHRFSTWIYVHNIRDLLSTPQGLDQALDWCRKTAVTRVYLESFRDGYQVEALLLKRVKAQFQRNGFDVHGAITPTEFGKRSSGWRGATCFTDATSQEKLQAMVEHCASVFDEILVDDFFFTDCKCSDCDTSRAGKIVTVADSQTPVDDDSWPKYRSELLQQVLLRRMIEPARAVNPRVKIMLKYASWYDRFYQVGCDVLRQLPELPRVVLGIETRDRDKNGFPPYRAYYTMRWMEGLAKEKSGGGWYDWLSTTPRTFVEQGRQAVLAGAKESMLCCYGGLIYDKVSMPCCYDGVKENTGPENTLAIRRAIPELLQVSKEVQNRRAIGLAAYFTPAGSGRGDNAIFDCVGTLGIPLIPCHEFPVDAPAAFFSMHILVEPDCRNKLRAFVATGRPVLMTHTLAKAVSADIGDNQVNVSVLPADVNTKSVWSVPAHVADGIRAPLLKAFALTLECPSGVSFYPFHDGSWVLENFTNEPVVARLNGQSIEIAPRGWCYRWK